MQYDKKTRRDYMARYRKARRQKALLALGNRCAVCGAVESLEFDHIDRFTKVNTIANLYDAPKSVFWTEVEKCQLLCKLCHIDKSIEAGDIGKTVHGTISMYSRYKCRCAECKSAMAAYRKEYRSKRTDAKL